MTVLREYMEWAIALAEKGMGFTSPNPMVGAVIVKDNQVIAEGYHHKYGELHAEREAFADLQRRYGEDAGKMAKGATMYVTLEPCCHHGKQPPCTEAIVEYGIEKVVIGSRDPNPLVSGKGVKYLQEHNIFVQQDFMKEECDEINAVFFHYITTKKPYVVMKYAMTLDGKIATRTGESKWITGETAREHVHMQRGRYRAIMAGIGTVLADNPLLSCRAPGMELPQPIRIVVDSHLRIPLESRLVQTAEEYETLIVCADKERSPVFLAKKKELENRGVKVLNMPGKDKRVDLQALMSYLGQQGIDSVYIEGGGQLHEAALKSGIVNHVCAYVAPKIFGGKEAKTPVEGEGINLPVQSPTLKLQKVTQLGEDLLLDYEVEGGMQGVYWNC